MFSPAYVPFHEVDNLHQIRSKVRHHDEQFILEDQINKGGAGFLPWNLWKWKTEYLIWVFANDHSLNIYIVYLESLPEGFHISYPHIEEG